jgi:hypothetical protein
VVLYASSSITSPQLPAAAILPAELVRVQLTDDMRENRIYSAADDLNTKLVKDASFEIESVGTSTIIKMDKFRIEVPGNVGSASSKPVRHPQKRNPRLNNGGFLSSLGMVFIELRYRLLASSRKCRMPTMPAKGNSPLSLIRWCRYCGKRYYRDDCAGHVAASD